MTAAHLQEVARLLEMAAVPIAHRLAWMWDDEHGQECLVCTCGLRSYDMDQGPH